MAAISIELGARVGLIGDAHGNLPFLIEAVFTLEERKVTSIVQLGDFGMLWSGAAHELEGIHTLSLVLDAMDLDFFVVLGNHENYDLVDALEAEPDGTRQLGRVVILPRSGRLTAAGRPAGFLAGAGSIDRFYRIPWQSWWPPELPTDDEALALVDQDDATSKVDILFAHDALRGPALQGRLLANRHLWREDGLLYAEAAAELFTERALTVLSDCGLVVSGHYHFRHSADEVLVRPDGAPLQVRSEVLSSEWEHGAVGLLDAQTLSVETWAVDPENARVNYNALRTKPLHWASKPDDGKA